MNIVYWSGDYVVYQNDGSSRFNLGKQTRSGKPKFIRGYGTREEAVFAADNQPKKKHQLV